MKNNFKKDDLEKILKKYKNEINKSNCDSNKKVYYFICKYFLNDGIDINEEEFDQKCIITGTHFDIAWNDVSNNELIFIKFHTREKIINESEEIINNIRNETSTYNSEFEIDIDDNNLVKYFLINIDTKENINRIEAIIEELNDSLNKKENEEFEILNFEKFNEKISLNIKQDLFVHKWTFDIDKNGNYLEYDKHDKYKAYVCNISAKSLKKLHETYGNTILNLNLRFFKKEKKVDDEIKKSIKNGNEFWLLNNGIYIICDSAKFVNNNVIINKFSIINGGQTTFNISTNNFDNDFYLLAKIVIIKNWGNENEQEESYQFANKVALASNRQKPIKNKDLIANLPSINELKQAFIQFRDFKDNKYIFLEVKKGGVKLCKRTRRN